jgi:hypothetical protein
MPGLGMTQPRALDEHRAIDRAIMDRDAGLWRR